MNTNVSRLIKSIARKPVIFILAIFVILSIGGTYLCTAMAMTNNGNGQMSAMAGHMGLAGGAKFDCFMTNQQASCQSNVGEHIQMWQELFNVIVAQDVMALLFAMTLVWAWYVISRKWLTLVTQRVARYIRTYRRDHPDIAIYNVFRELFSNGIIQPKLYA